jgi:hypothetical protein
LVLLVAFAPVAALLPDRAERGDEGTLREARVPQRSLAILCLLLLATAGRAFLAARMVAFVALDAGAGLIFAIAVAACVGKMLGGVLADRAGWTRSAVGYLLASALLLYGTEGNLWMALFGVAFFQTATSITLASLYRFLPERIGLAFGLSCLSLFIGSLPVLLRFHLGWLEHAPANALVALLSAATVWRALSWSEEPGRAFGVGQPASRISL